ncbi:protease inhibitor I42 family protein [Streptomyces sp. NBC_00249]|uniref:protease inhibitor I42 family protein n=1 Tax=Streptomyces sp. NBC_00249 TaxID=2975690 RepID=UPI00225366A3|nr:protease inhibitor I42 family protein [Streptomyces sp. NBC_00249]MCX5196167.1 protease inhibitor I42 family protein [Streptomyces sp. NBC_00249]
MEVREIELAPGESYTLRLTGRGARGYVWTWRVGGDEDAVSVAEGPESAGRRAEPGAALERAYTVRAVRAGGRARIRFAQVRPPYPQEAPYDEFLLEVTVTAGA